MWVRISVSDRVKPVICNFWHPALARSKITNDDLTRSDTGCVPKWQQWASKGFKLPIHRVWRGFKRRRCLSVRLSVCSSVANRSYVRFVGKLPNQSTWTFRTMLGQCRDHDYWMQYYDAITNPRWRTAANVSLCRHMSVKNDHPIMTKFIT